MMISPSPPSHWLCSRRALARISSMPTSLESSTHSGALASRWLAFRIFGQRCSATRPLRSSSPLMRACEATKRCASSASAISSENSATGLAVLDGGVLGDVADERALAHRRARGDDDQVARLEAAGDLVEVLEARRRAGQRGAFERQLVQLVELLVQHVLDRAEVLLAVVARDLEHRLLGLLDELARRRVVAEHALLDLVRGLQQPPQQRVLAHDLRVAAGVPGGRDEPGELVDRRRPAGVLELARLCAGGRSPSARRPARSRCRARASPRRSAPWRSR